MPSPDIPFKATVNNLYELVEQLGEIKKLLDALASESIRSQVMGADTKTNQRLIVQASASVDKITRELNQVIDRYFLIRHYPQKELITAINEAPTSYGFKEQLMPDEWDSLSLVDKWLIEPLEEEQKKLSGGQQKQSSLLKPLAENLAYIIKAAHKHANATKNWQSFNEGLIPKLFAYLEALESSDAFSYQDNLKAAKASAERMGKYVKTDFNPVTRVYQEILIDPIKELKDDSNPVSIDFSLIKQSWVVPAGAAAGNCYGYMRHWAEGLLKKNISDQDRKKQRSYSYEASEAYEGYENLPENFKQTIQRERQQQRQVFASQTTQASRAADNVLIHNKRLTRHFYFGTGEKQKTTLLLDKLFRQARTHLGQPMWIDLFNSEAGHSLGFSFNKTHDEKTKETIEELQFLDANTGKVTLRGKNVEAAFRAWFSNYAKVNLNDYDVFQIGTHKPKRKRALLFNAHHSLSGKWRSFLTGSRYSGLPGILTLVHAIKRAYFRYFGSSQAGALGAEQQIGRRGQARDQLLSVQAHDPHKQAEILAELQEHESFVQSVRGEKSEIRHGGEGRKAAEGKNKDKKNDNKKIEVDKNDDGERGGETGKVDDGSSEKKDSTTSSAASASTHRLGGHH